MKRIIFLLSALILGSAMFAQSNLSPRDLEKMRLLGEEQTTQAQQINEKDPAPSSFPMEPTDAMFDLLFQFPAGDGSGEYAVATDGDFIYTSKWNAPGNFFKYEMNGTFIGSFAIAGAANIRDLTYDGTYFYGSPNSGLIYQMDFTTQTLVGTINATGTVRAIAYDGNADAFWVSNGWNPPLRLISRTGTVLATLNTAASSFSALAWENVTDGSPYLWAYTQPASNNILVQLNIETGATIQTYDVASSVTFGAGAISGGMVITDLVYPGKWAFLGTAQNDVIWAMELADSAPAEAPGAATNLTAVAGAMGALNAQISFNNPSTTVGGDPLTELTSVVIHRNGELIHTVANPVIGGAVNYTDNAVPAAGLITYSVIAENSAGAGVPANVTVYVGEDVPAAPGNVTLVAQGNNGFITWSAPTEGYNGGYFTGQNLTYTVKRFPGAITVASNISALEYLDTSIPSAGNYYYEVTASNNVGEGGTGTSNVALLGAEGVMLLENFDIPANTIPTGWQVVGLGPTNWGASATTFAGGTAPEMRLTWTPSFVGNSALVTHAIPTNGNTNLHLSLRQQLNNYDPGTHMIKIGYSVDGGTTWTFLWEYVGSASYGPALENFEFTIPGGSTSIHIGFHFSGDSFDINQWYFDEIILEAITGSAPQISVDPEAITETLAPGQTSTQELTVSNLGENNLTYSVAIQYPDKSYNIVPVPEGELGVVELDLSAAGKTSGGNPEMQGIKDEVILNYDGPNNDAIGLTAGGTFHLAARFPSAMTAPYTGYMLESVDVYINDVPSSAILKIWAPGTSTAPGAVIHEQPFTGVLDSWMTLTLTEPLYIDGTDLWVGYTVTHGAGQFPAGCDAGPANVNGDFISTDGSTWQKLSGFGLNYNWNVRAKLLPGGAGPWISISPNSGTVGGLGSQVITVSFNAEELEMGTYNANLVITSNDANNPVVTVPVTLQVTDGDILLGDSNCDGTVNVIDIITTVNYILGNSPQPFCFENADVNGDGTVNVIDVIGTVNIILN